MAGGTQSTGALVEPVLPGQISRRLVLFGPRKGRHAHGHHNLNAVQMSPTGRFVKRDHARHSVSDLRTGPGFEQQLDARRVIMDARVL